jgi:folate-binding protein YgfZ
MVLLPQLNAVRISGTDAGDFLHNQVSADILALAENDSTFACYCEPKGRVLALMLISRHGDEYYVIMSSSLAETISTRLKIYVMRSKVSIELLTDALVAGDAGLSSVTSVPAELANLPVPNSDNKLLVLREADSALHNLAQQALWKLSELHRGIVWLSPETSGQYLPQMLGFNNIGAVNFRKGCYPGQEIVARTHYLGKVKRHPRLLCTAAVICPTEQDKLQIYSGDQSHAAVIADCGLRDDGGCCIFVVTRMSPEDPADAIEYQGNRVSLTPAKGL